MVPANQEQADAVERAHPGYAKRRDWCCEMEPEDEDCERATALYYALCAQEGEPANVLDDLELHLRAMEIAIAIRAVA
jgi:hypothetical protein